MPFDSFNIGKISISSEIDLSGYQKSKQKLIADVDRLGETINSRLSQHVSSSFSGAGRGLADSIGRDFPRQGLQLQNSLGGTITGAILKANFATAIAGQIVGGVVRAGSLITQPLQDIVSAISGSISEGLSFQNANRIRTEILSVSSALSGVAQISFDDAQASIEGLNDRLAESAAALPGTTEGFLRIARGISDEIARASQSAETGLFDAQRWEDTTARLSELAGVLDAASVKNIRLTTMGLSRALNAGTIGELRQLQLFTDNPTLLNSIQSQIQSIGAESLRDVTIEGRALILERALETVVTPELLDRASESADGLIQAFLSRLGDPTGGIFSISRELESTGTSVFDTLTETLRATIGEGSGLFDRLIASAQSAGLRLGDPMEALQGVILRVNEAIAYLAENTDEFFRSGFGQTLVDIVNTLQEKIPQAFGFLVRLGGEIFPAVISGLQTISQLAGSAFNAIAGAVPDLGALSLDFQAPDLSGLSGVVGAITNAFALARNTAQSFFESFSANVDLGGFFQAGSSALEGFIDLVSSAARALSNFVTSNGPQIERIGGTIGAVFGAGVTAVGDIVSAVSRRFMPVMQRAATSMGRVFGAIWDGLRPIREWFASDETQSFLTGALDGLARIGEILAGVIGVSLIAALKILEDIFVRSGLIEGVFRVIGGVVITITEGVGGLLNVVSRWGDLVEATKGSFSAIVEIIRLRLREALTNVVSLVQDRLGPAAEFVGNVFDAIVDTVQDIWEWLDRSFGAGERLSGVFEVVKTVAEGIVSAIASMFEGLQRITGLGQRQQQQQQRLNQFTPGGSEGFVSPLQGQSLQQTIDYQQSAGQDFDAYRAYRQGYHAGIDFDARIGGGEGGIVQSVTDGVVTEINELFRNAEGEGGSVQVRIETTDATGQTVQQRYTHLSRQAVREAGLAVGQQVRAGQVIGAVGSTDSVSSGAHLDYKVTVNGQFVNPDEFLSLAGAAGQLTTLDVRSGRQGQVNIGAIASQGRAQGLGQGLGAGLTQANAALGQNINPVYSGLRQRFQGVQGDQAIAAAFYGNFVQESGLDPTAVNPFGGASGLAQWLGSRQEELKEFAARMGKEWSDLDVQLDFVLHELETSESAAWQKIQEVAATGDVAATTRAVRVYYERPGEHEAADDRRIAAAQQIAQEGATATTAPPSTTALTEEFLDPTQRYARELAAVERLLSREGQLRQQARQEEDRERSLALEQQTDALRAQQAELDPTDTAGARIIDARIRELQILSQESDRLLQVERQITDLIAARDRQQAQQANLDAQRAALESGTPGITQQDILKLESEISPINFDEAIANFQEYGAALEEQLTDKLRPLRASMSQFATQAVEDSRRVLRSIADLNRQYSEPSAFEQHQAAVEGIGLAYEENGKKLDQTISTLRQLAEVENLTEEQYSQLTQQLEAATAARENLSAAEERAISIANETYEAQQRLATINLAEQLMQPQLRAAEAEAQSIERFDQFGANTIRRQAALATLGTRFAEEMEAINTQSLQLLRQFEQAQEVGDQATLDRFQALGIGSAEDIQAIVEQNRAAIDQVYMQELQGIRDQFPTVADAFRNNLRDATSQGLTQGFRGLAEGGGVGEFFGGLFNSVADAVLNQGAQRLSDFLTGGLFGNGEGGGLLGGILGANEDSIPGQAGEASGILDQGGLAAGQRMIDGATAAANILANAGSGGLQFGSVDLGGDAGGLLGGVTQAASGLLGGGAGAIPQTVSGLLDNADGLSFGSIVAEGFQAKMPEAGSVLAGGRGQGFLGSLVQGLGGLFGGGGLGGSRGGGAGSTISTLLGIAGSFFRDGGYVGNLAGGGIAAAMSRERSASGRSPRLAVVNDGEFIFRSEAVDRIGTRTLDAMNRGDYVPNYAIGGSIAERSVDDAPVFGQYQVPTETNTSPQQINYKFQTEMINQREYVSKDQLDLLEQKVNAAPQQGAAAAIEAFRASPAARARAGI